MAYAASTNTVYVPCWSLLRAVHISGASFSVTTLRSGYAAVAGDQFAEPAGPPIVSGGAHRHQHANNWSISHAYAHAHGHSDSDTANLSLPGLAGKRTAEQSSGRNRSERRRAGL